jgi:hypothetical protein
MMSHEIHHGGSATAAANAVIADPLSFTLVIEGGLPDAVVGDVYEVSAPAGVIMFSSYDATVTSVDAGNNDRAELVFNAPAGFNAAGVYKIEIRKAGEPGVLATLQVTAAAAAPVVVPPVNNGGGNAQPSSFKVWFSKLPRWGMAGVSLALAALGVAMIIFMIRTFDRAFLDSHHLPESSITWISKSLSTSSKPDFSNAKLRQKKAKEKAEAEAKEAAPK